MDDSRLTKAQIDKLGDRLRAGDEAPEALELLEEFRALFRPVDTAAARLINSIGIKRLEISRRAGKSTPSILAKLRRESLRLSQMQDIAGCRIIVDYLTEQDELARRLTRKSLGSRIQDRRAKPSHGYRAVHVILRISDLPYEVQIRTVAQDLWAQLVEKLSDSKYPDLKYGKGTDSLLTEIQELSDLEYQFDKTKDALVGLERALSGAKTARYGVVTPAMVSSKQREYDRLAQRLDDRFEKLGGL